VGLLDGRRALVTGAGQGIGRAICLAYAAEGAAVAAVDIDEPMAAETTALVRAAGGKASAHRCDVAVRAQVDATVSAAVGVLGGLDILVNVAIAGAPRVPLLETTEELAEVMWRTGPLGTMFFLQACHPFLKAAGAAAVINFVSGAGISGDIGNAAYGPAKEGVRSLTKVAAREFGPDGIRVNAIAPAAKTRLMQAWIDEDPARAEAATAAIPLRRFGEPADIARAAVYLASDYAAFTTGHTLLVDGGSCRF
jgi:NAD(P)-dependent dehydrogenase (short-subunit alcohol dehydrogenase family)